MIKNKNITEKFVIIFAIILSIIAWIISFRLDYVLVYNDAASHLNIARRVIDSLTPGLAQIGTVWLPLPHLLMLPFVWNNFLWHTALAGSIVSMGAYVVSAVFMYKLINLLTNNRWASTLGTLILILNPNFLYLQTTPLTEVLFMATSILSTYFLAKYIKTKEILNLILTGVFVMTSTLTRYDGWFLFVSLLVLIPLWGCFIFGRKRTEGIFFLFASIGGFGILLWLLWNLTIFGDALYFMSGPYSARAQQSILQSVGQLPAKGNIYLSFFYFIWSIIGNNGMIITAVGALSVLAIPFILKNKGQLIVYLAILSPFVFNILALYLGQSAMNIPQAPQNPGLFNIRYGILMLPALALILGTLASRKQFIWIIVIALISQSTLFIFQGKPIALADGIKGLENTYYTVEASKWLFDNYQGGLILTSLASHDAFVARTGLPLKLYIHEGTREHWQQALETPSAKVSYIVLLSYPPDVVYQALENNLNFQNNYQLVHSYGTFEIYKLQAK